MIASEARARAWKYFCLVLAVLAVAAVVAAAFFHGRSLLASARADAASRRADAAEAAVAALKLAIERDDHSAEATAEARASADQRTTERDDRVARVEVIANERREAVPVGCPLLMLGCLPSCKTVEPVFVPPRIDCAATDAPRAKRPVEPALTDKEPVLWQLYAWAWQEYAFDVLSQRVETAQCLHDLRQKGVIK